MAEATHFIVNPHGNYRRDGRRWMARQRQCLRELAPARVTAVESPAEAAQVARQIALEGFRKIVSVGDAATANGVVNGLMELAEGHRSHLRVGLLSLAQPDQWSRTVDLPRGLARQLEVLAAGHTQPFDVGRVECEPEPGKPAIRHFLNGASVGPGSRQGPVWGNGRRGLGLAAAVAWRAEALQRLALGTVPTARLEGPDGLLYEGPCALALVMGGRYYPALGQVAPQADPTDGLLDVAWLDDGPRWAIALRLAALWVSALAPRGLPLGWHRLERLRVTASGSPLHVEADGQPLGRLPATFSVVPRALPLIVPPVAVKLRKPAFKSVEKLSNGHVVAHIKSAAGM